MREPANISVDEYHEIADAYIDELVATLEEKAETAGSGYDVEYSVSSYPTLASSPGGGGKRKGTLFSAGVGSQSGADEVAPTGRRVDAQDVARHLRAEQAAAEPADLDLVTHVRPEAL